MTLKLAYPHETTPQFGRVDLLLEAIAYPFSQAIDRHERVRDIFSAENPDHAASQWKAWRDELFPWWDEYRKPSNSVVHWNYISPDTGKMYSKLCPRTLALSYELLKMELTLAWSYKILTELKVYQITGPGPTDIAFDIYHYPEGSFNKKLVEATSMAHRVALAHLLRRHL